jgi:hypothetical protein
LGRFSFGSGDDTYDDSGRGDIVAISSLLLMECRWSSPCSSPCALRLILAGGGVAFFFQQPC